MRSIFWKILLWFFITVVLCIAGSQISGRFRRFAPGRPDFFSRSLTFQLENARAAYETGGKLALRALLVRLDEYFSGQYALLDAHGVDVLTGADRNSDLKQLMQRRSWRPGQSRMTLAWPSRDRRYQLLIDEMVPPPPPSPIPVYLWIIAAAIAFASALAVQLVSPLRALEQTIERFGRGDLRIRADTSRKDEFGKFAEAINRMADRIETLLTAERRLLQDVSHELRSPLARLEFAIELARTSPDREKAFARIKKETGRLTVLVSELLQVTRAETDPGSRNMDTLPLPSLLRDLLDDSAAEAPARQCRLELFVREPVVARGDRELIRRAIENVVRNAVRYAPRDTSVEVTLERRENRALIRVRDFGPGVSEASLPHLFQPFFRAEEDRNRNSGGGVGLGLSIALRAVRAHEGTMRACNASPGLIVEIELPLVTPQVRAVSA